MHALTLALMLRLGALLPSAQTLVVLPLDAADNVPVSDVEMLNAVLAQEVVRQNPGPVMNWMEVAQTQRRAAQGCADAPCAVDVGRALGVDDVVIGKVGRVGTQQVLAIYRVRVADGRVMGSSVTRLGSGDGAVLDALPRAVAELMRVPAASITSHPMEPDGGTRQPDDGMISFEMEGGNLGTALDWGAVAFPVEGPAKHRLSWTEFYRRVGRTDLAESLETRTKARLRLTWISSLAGGFGIVVVSGAALAGLGMLLVPLALRSNPPPGIPPQYLGVGGPLWWGGLVLMAISGLAGFLIFTAGTSFPNLTSLVSPQPVGEAEIRALADDYNRSL